MSSEIEQKRRELEEHMDKNILKNREVFREYRLAYRYFNLGVEMAQKEDLRRVLEILNLSYDYFISHQKYEVVIEQIKQSLLNKKVKA